MYGEGNAVTDPVRRPPPYALDFATLQRESRIDVYRAAGAGGQHVNRTESAVRMVHLPSGVVVTASDTRSQIRNREIALERLIERLKRLNRVQRKRVPTRVPRSTKVRRMEEKRRRGETKRRRSSLDE